MMHKKRTGELAVCYMCKNDRHDLCDTGEHYYCHCTVCQPPCPLKCIGKSRHQKVKLPRCTECFLEHCTCSTR